MDYCRSESGSLFLIIPEICLKFATSIWILTFWGLHCQLVPNPRDAKMCINNLILKLRHYYLWEYAIFACCYVRVVGTFNHNHIYIQIYIFRVKQYCMQNISTKRVIKIDFQESKQDQTKTYRVILKCNEQKIQKRWNFFIINY